MELFQNKKVFRFVQNMRKIPKKVLRCDVYGTSKIVVDERHAKNILRKVFPTISSSDLYHAVSLMGEFV